jgi:uncharacterized membrane protein YeiH
VFWLTDPAYLTTIACAALATVGYTRWRQPNEAALLVADALGLALFSVAGAQIGERAGLWAGAGVVLGTITGAAGGAVRDVLCAEVPLVLRRGNLYASAAIAGTALYFLLQRAGADRNLATYAGMATVASVRLAAIWWRLQLPVFRLDPNDIDGRRDGGRGRDVGPTHPSPPAMRRPATGPSTAPAR